VLQGKDGAAWQVSGTDSASTVKGERGVGSRPAASSVRALSVTFHVNVGGELIGQHAAAVCELGIDRDCR